MNFPPNKRKKFSMRKSLFHLELQLLKLDIYWNLFNAHRKWIEQRLITFNKTIVSGIDKILSFRSEKNSRGRRKISSRFNVLRLKRFDLPMAESKWLLHLSNLFRLSFSFSGKETRKKLPIRIKSPTMKSFAGKLN